MKRIYLDYAATTPVDSEVIKAMRPYFSKQFGNPASIHSFGQEALTGLDKAREQVANFLGCQPREIVFTSGATEANNLALKGVIRSQKTESKSQKLHLITTKIEHHCILETCKALEKEGVKVTYLPVDKEGLVDPQKIERAITDQTVLVSIMYANNEIGTIQPIREIGKIIEKLNKKRKKLIIFHTDAAQAAGYLDCNVKRCHVDSLSLSGHKIYGPKGVGALYLRSGTPMEPILHGGDQEYEIRAGTENVAGIVGLGQAIELVVRVQPALAGRIKKLREHLINGVLKNIPNSELNGSREKRLPNNANFSFPGTEGESIVISLDQVGIAASTGSACSSRALEPSHVLLAMGYSPLRSHSSLRLTLGKQTTEKEIEQILKVLPGIITRLRKISGKK